MSHSKNCPNCGSDAIISLPEHNQNYCLDCHHGWAMNASVSPNDPQIKLFCKNIADSTAWVEKVANKWPTPIAHEYRRLREILGEEQLIISAMWQLKDVAEVLIKFSTIVMAQWVVTQQNDTRLVRAVQDKLLSKSPSMGDWYDLAADILAPVLCQTSKVSKVAGLFRTPKITPLYKLLDQLIIWRNDKFGHGALGLEIDKPFKDELAYYVKQLNTLLDDYQDIWDDMPLQDINGQILQGWQSIRHQGLEEDIALQLRLGKQQTLSLSPWITLKRCTVCHQQHVFFFQSRDLKGKKNF
jgi:hypothetical protein